MSTFLSAVSLSAPKCARTICIGCRDAGRLLAAENIALLHFARLCLSDLPLSLDSSERPKGRQSNEFESEVVR